MVVVATDGTLTDSSTQFTDLNGNLRINAKWDFDERARNGVPLVHAGRGLAAFKDQVLISSGRD